MTEAAASPQPAIIKRNNYNNKNKIIIESDCNQSDSKNTCNFVLCVLPGLNYSGIAQWLNAG